MKVLLYALLLVLCVSTSYAQNPPNGPIAGMPASVPASQPAKSNCISMGMLRYFTMYVAMTGAATIQSQRYADNKCTQTIGTAVPSSPQALAQTGTCPSSSFCGAASNVDNSPFLFLVITITDTSGSANPVIATNLITTAP